MPLWYRHAQAGPGHTSAQCGGAVPQPAVLLWSWASVFLRETHTNFLPLNSLFYSKMTA